MSAVETRKDVLGVLENLEPLFRAKAEVRGSAKTFKRFWPHLMKVISEAMPNNRADAIDRKIRRKGRK